MATQPLNNIVRIDVEISPRSAARRTFDLGLILGDSDVFDDGGRIRIYNQSDALAAMQADGFDPESPEMKAATLYFSQAKKAPQVAVGAIKNGESALAAVQACRALRSDWYALHVCDLPDADAPDVAAFIETTSSVLFHGTSQPDVLAGTTGNVLETLKSRGYRRTLTQYSSVPYAAAAIMGYAMGANTGLAGSAFTLKFKGETGVAAEDLNATSIGIIENNNGNLYLNYGEAYNIFEQGVMASGDWFDEILGLDILVNDIRLTVMDLLAGTPKIPQTPSGVARIMNAINPACAEAVKTGFLAPGVWNGGELLHLADGDMLKNGYRIMAESVYDQPQAERDARICPPIYIACKLAGAIHSVQIGVKVNR